MTAEDFIFELGRLDFKERNAGTSLLIAKHGALFKR